MKFLVFILIQFLSACSTSRGQLTEDIDSEKNVNENESNPLELTDDEFPSLPSQVNDLPFPKKASAWDIQSLLLTNEKPPLESLETCVSEITLAAHNSNNERELFANQKKITETINNNYTLYHWCFFLIASRMDQQLDSSGIDLKEKSIYFLERMKQLWLLSFVLDLKNSEHHYFNFLQKRYIHISKQKFGRNLSIIGIPLNKRPLKTIKPSKPAEEFIEQ